jgi:cobalt/nickel transport system permease protein
MHLSDGFLNPSMAMFTAAAAATAVGTSVWQLYRGRYEPIASGRQPSPSAAEMAIVGAGVFAIQAINFPLSATVSGHLLGGVAAAAILGPWAGMLVVSTVLAVQCFLLGDGGVTALGANVLNMAVLGAVLGGPIHGISRRGMSSNRQALAAGLAAAASLPLGAILCAAEMHVAGKATFTATAGEMLPLHLLLALAEGLFTAAAVLTAERSAVVDRAAAFGKWSALALVAVLATTAILVPYSSELPDTLEAAAEKFGVIAADPLLAAAINDNTFAGTGAWMTVVLPIMLGTLLAFVASAVVGRSLMRTNAIASRQH